MARALCRGSVALTIAAISSVVLVWPAGAVGYCGTREALLSLLSNRYQEVPQAYGITYRGELIELLVSPGGISWSLAVTPPGGPTCLATAGEAWRVRSGKRSKGATFKGNRGLQKN